MIALHFTLPPRNPDFAPLAAMNPMSDPTPRELAPALKPLCLDALGPPAKGLPPWLWHGSLAPGNVTLLTSQWKSGKTTLVSVLLDRMKAGGQLAGLPVAAGKA